MHGRGECSKAEDVKGDSAPSAFSGQRSYADFAVQLLLRACSSSPPYHYSRTRADGRRVINETAHPRSR